MVTKWGVFVCTCHQTLSIDAQQLTLPTLYVQCAHDPDTEVQAFTSLVQRAECERVLIACCASSSLFEAALGRTGIIATNIHYVNLKDSCFQVHPDPIQAHAKASRLLQAAVQGATAQADPVYQPLSAAGRILMATDGAPLVRLAAQLRGVAQPFFVVPSDLSGFDSTARVYRGRIVEVQGRLGDFRVKIEEVTTPQAVPRELQADQVVIVASDRVPPIKARTGCHVLLNPSDNELDGLGERIRDLIGDFLKTVHLGYHADVCAGGAADQEACGRCISACPYEAITRDAQNHLRVQVDHMACEGCGACVSACPTSALRFTGPSPYELYTRLGALLTPPVGADPVAPRLMLFHCGEQGRRVLEEAGRRGLTYPAQVLPLAVPCLRYVSAANMLAAFRCGAAGVGLLGCTTCPHGERQGLYQQVEVAHLLLEAFDLGAGRLRLLTAAAGSEVEAIADLCSFAEGVTPPPMRWDGRPLRHMGNREVMIDAIASFIEQTGREPGRTPLAATQPFAIAEVQASGCTLCRACVNVCPVHAFKLDEPTASLQYKHLACVACGLCEQVCPEHVIGLRHEVDLTRAALAYQTVVQDEMMGCTQCGRPYINRKALQAIEAKVLSLGSLLDTFAGKRQTLLRMCPDCRAVAAMLEVEKGWEP